MGSIVKHTKLILTASAFLTATLFRIFDFIDQETWFKTVATVISAYGLANVGSTWAHGRGDGGWRS